jgi:hypothetical protein
MREVRQIKLAKAKKDKNKDLALGFAGPGICAQYNLRSVL